MLNKFLGISNFWNQHLIVRIIIVLLLVISFIFLKVKKYLFNSESVELSKEQSATVLNYNRSKNTIEESVSNYQECDLEESKWLNWWGTYRQEVSDNSSDIYLPPKSNQVLFKFGLNIDSTSNCIFKFIPRGDHVINYVISFDDAYELVIGNNDYWTISLSSINTKDGKFYPVKEKNKNIERPRLLSKIQKGSIVSVDLNQKFVSKDLYYVSVDINYQPDTYDPKETETEKFEWFFIPPSKIALNDMELSVGLIRGNTAQDVGATFVYPDPLLKLKELD